MKKKETHLDILIRNWRIREAEKYIINRGVVCDLGCGREGFFLTKISGRINRGIGFDMEVEDMERGNISLIQANLDKGVPLDDSAVDCVTSLAVIEHVNCYESFAREIRRILKPGGRCVLTTPAPRARSIWEFLMKRGLIAQTEDIHEHKKYLSETELVALFEGVGFLEVKFRKFQFGFNNLIVAKK